MQTTVAVTPTSPGVEDKRQPCLLSVTGISKSFPGVVALDDVSFQLRRGTVHALMGENGAGKSTLMKILAGIYQPDAGEIHLDGVSAQFKTPLDALMQGVGMIHQELNLMPSMTVAENIWIGREPRNRFGIVDHPRMNRLSRDLLTELKINLDPEMEVRHLSIASRQMVEIAKAVSYRSRVLIMDEPTSALTERESAQLFEIIDELRTQGIGIVYISHKMHEIFEISDEISVFRDGKYIGTHAAAATSRDEIIRMMVGRDISTLFPKENVPTNDILFSVRDLALRGVFSGVSFDLRAGEILGLAGLIGSGRSNVAETIFGVTPATSGEIRIREQRVDLRSPRDAIANGMAFLTEDRKQSGCFLALDILENIQIAALRNQFVKAGFVQNKAIAAACSEMSRTLRVKSSGIHTTVENLSGGNQQKVLIGRWLLTKPRILILDEPTRGIDVAAKAEIHALVSALASTGAGVILISSEMPEVIGMSDRIMVMHEGKITGVLDRDEATQVKIMELASK
ncbi:MAG: sugar ABC transporter ATP-binding protein [Mesorhizobium sp.]|nr:sugar ABC transporter ATP-binding protein [Mesorhizobium sp.]TIO06228.1 MAG: sugar ABC transporter ATP-binding protein [Mesorhizobium sp.]TIO36355.1 MAG: sugar ABC transporter ATP-binding protein [Mesorhizobium sp.]TIP11253.1 MAG: sugar ABC transporter ATP-binding protein [Mesorhizobium sp.]